MCGVYQGLLQRIDAVAISVFLLEQLIEIEFVALIDIVAKVIQGFFVNIVGFWEDFVTLGGENRLVIRIFLEQLTLDLDCKGISAQSAAAKVLLT